jgi:hypothetical protein
MTDHAAPPPGTGTVFIQANRLGEWSASWQAQDGEPSAVSSLDDVTREEAIAWAREQPAVVRLICEPGESDYTPLT